MKPQWYLRLETDGEFLERIRKELGMWLRPATYESMDAFAERYGRTRKIVEIRPE